MKSLMMKLNLNSFVARWYWLIAALALAFLVYHAPNLGYSLPI